MYITNMANTILLLSGIYPPDVGGPAKFVSVYSKWLAPKSWKVFVVSFSNSKKVEILEDAIHVNLICRQSNLIVRYMSTVFQIYRSSVNSQHILANGLFIELLIASKLFRLPYSVKVPGDIVWERAKNKSITTKSVEDFQSEKLGWKYRIFRSLNSRCLRDAQAVIVPSEQLFRLCAIWGVPKHRIHLVHNSVFTDFFIPIEQPKEFDVLTVARLVKWKGIDEIIKICSKNDLKMLIVGDGPEMANLKNIAKEVGARVKFVGDTDQKDLVEYYNQSRCFVLNSSFEASSYSLIEAMSCSLPVIASRNTGSAEVITHRQDGLLIDKNYSLQNALTDLFSSNELALQMGISARRKVSEQFNSEVNFQIITDIISETVK